jgi:hypothetical protein
VQALAPDLAQLVAGQHLAGVRIRYSSSANSFRSVRPPRRPPAPARARVEHQRPDSSSRGWAAPAAEGAQAGAATEGERLDEVVVGARVEASDRSGTALRAVSIRIGTLFPSARSWRQTSTPFGFGSWRSSTIASSARRGRCEGRSHRRRRTRHQSRSLERLRQNADKRLVVLDTRTCIAEAYRSPIGRGLTLGGVTRRRLVGADPKLATTSGGSLLQHRRDLPHECLGQRRRPFGH